MKEVTAAADAVFGAEEGLTCGGEDQDFPDLCVLPSSILVLGMGGGV